MGAPPDNTETNKVKTREQKHAHHKWPPPPTNNIKKFQYKYLFTEITQVITMEVTTKH